MSLLNETERPGRVRRKYRKRRKVRPSQAMPSGPLDVTHPDQVLSFSQWCQFNSISPSTGRRILASADGPVVTQLTAGRIGVTIGNNAKWLRSKERV